MGVQKNVYSQGIFVITLPDFVASGNLLKPTIFGMCCFSEVLK
jgi:hypothetical protein